MLKKEMIDELIGAGLEIDESLHYAKIKKIYEEYKLEIQEEIQEEIEIDIEKATEKFKRIEYLKCEKDTLKRRITRLKKNRTSLDRDLSKIKSLETARELDEKEKNRKDNVEKELIELNRQIEVNIEKAALIPDEISALTKEVEEFAIKEARKLNIKAAKIKAERVEQIESILYPIAKEIIEDEARFNLLERELIQDRIKVSKLYKHVKFDESTIKEATKNINMFSGKLLDVEIRQSLQYLAKLENFMRIKMSIQGR